jgi:hypothetical protein
MSTVLTVQSNARDEECLRLGIATLPTSFRYVDGAADVAGIVGHTDWVGGAIGLIEDGARGVLVVDPSIADIEPLRTAANERGAAVVLDRGWAASPSVARAAAEFPRLATSGGLLESWLHAPTGADAANVLMRQLALIRAAVGGVETLRLIRNGAHGYDGLGSIAGGADLSLSAVFSTALGEAATVRIIRREASVVLELGPIDIASPGRLRVLGDASESSLITPWETPHRESWRRLHRAVLGGAVLHELDGFADDAQLAREALEGVNDAAR